ncbi:hypothetical protein [Terracoccus sp. 273MFTsu3.1]|uniref:hypothetical protein n=1 Tax=Terracoccus sp. 273MFTsu3.1 TaxID=1172188 RepID=UPI00036F36A0|nr:hypothetical protein [Terracoccus sp. 273MFTsu3.1]
MNNRVATAGLVAFLAVDVALVAFALRSGHNASQALPPVSATRTAALSTSPPTTAVTGPTEGVSPASVKAVPVTRLVSALDAVTAWRATTGACDAGGATVEVTADGGQTWTRLRSPARAVARVQPLDETRAFVIGAGPACTLAQYASRDAGRTWLTPTAVSGGWARRLDEPTRVLAPKEAAATPCGDAVVVDLSRTSAAQAQALCADGSVVVTDDGGTTWTGSGDAPGAVALSNLLVDTTLKTYAVRIVGACKGVQLVEVVKGRTAAVVACVPVATPERGSVGLSVTDRAGWIVSGNQTWLSQGDLTSWKRV